jgi:hypothetical protein
MTRLGIEANWSVVLMGAALILLTLFARGAASESQGETSSASAISSDQPDFNRQIYYKNKLEFAYDTGALFYNTPLLLDPVIGSKFQRTPGAPDYTLIPQNFSLRWHLYDIKGRSFWRGNTDFSVAGNYTVYAQGPESYYTGVIFGLRYNFIQPNWRLVPYFDLRGGFGMTDAQHTNEARENKPEVGQAGNFQFNFSFGSGIRYNPNPNFGVSLGCAFMHISSAYLTRPNHGINVFGPTAGFDLALPRLSEMMHSL